MNTKEAEIESMADDIQWDTGCSEAEALRLANQEWEKRERFGHAVLAMFQAVGAAKAKA